MDYIWSILLVFTDMVHAETGIRFS